MTVVVGVSPSTGSPTALRWAAREAELRKIPLRAVLAWRPPRPPAAPGGRPPLGTAYAASSDYAGDADRDLREFVVAALGSDAGVECRAIRGTVVNALLAAAGDADLLVIGEPQPGRVASARVTRLVAPQVVLRSPCPVVVMPGSSAVVR